MCLKCEKSTSHVSKRVKSEQHMWGTCENMWLGCEPILIQCDFSVGEGLGGHCPPQLWRVGRESQEGQREGR